MKRKARPKRTALTRPARDQMVRSYVELKDTRAGEMMAEDLVAMDQFGENSVRLGLDQDGNLSMISGRGSVSDAIEPALRAARVIPTRMVPKTTTRETLDMLALVDAEGEEVPAQLPSGEGDDG